MFASHLIHFSTFSLSASIARQPLQSGSSGRFPGISRHSLRSRVLMLQAANGLMAGLQLDRRPATVA
jgi:hypothetical protein